MNDKELEQLLKEIEQVEQELKDCDFTKRIKKAYKKGKENGTWGS